MMFVDVSVVKRWARIVKGNKTAMINLYDHDHSGWPITTMDKSIKLLGRTDSCHLLVEQKDITVILGFSTEWGNHIHEMLGYKKACATWVPHMQTLEIKQCWWQVCQELLVQYGQEVYAFIHQIVTSNKSLTHDCDSENRCQSVEYTHKNSKSSPQWKKWWWPSIENARV